MSLEFDNIREDLRQQLCAWLASGNISGTFSSQGILLNGFLSYYPNRALTKFFVSGISEPVRIGQDNAHNCCAHIDCSSGKIYFSNEEIQNVGGNIGSIALGDANSGLCLSLIITTSQKSF